jgi:carbon-monoxide dehydrogenase medium subunit
MPELEIVRPRTVDEAVSLLASRDGSRCIAGGQTLVAMLNAGLVDVSTLVAVSGIGELQAVVTLPDGRVRIGAAVPHRAVADCDQLVGANVVIREAARVIAHPAIRNFGTIGGALAHADPAADYPAAVVAAGGKIEIAGPSGRRSVAAEEFFVDYLTTALDEGEMVTAVELPAPSAGSRGHYLKFSRVDGDYATVSVAVTLATNGGTCTAARIALGGCGPTPVFDAAAGAMLAGGRCKPEQIAAAAALLVERSDPVDDVRGSAAYRRAIIPRLVERAVRHAWSPVVGAQ